MLSMGSRAFSAVSSEGTHFCPFSGKKDKEGPEPVTGVTKQFRTLGCHQVTHWWRGRGD